METLLQVQEICKYYRMGEVQITAVDHVSFSVEKGEFVVIVVPTLPRAALASADSLS